jgi:hypothetical protein
MIRIIANLFAEILSDTVGNYKTIDKIIILIYQMVCGTSNKKLEIPEKTIQLINEKLWKKE